MLLLYAGEKISVEGRGHVLLRARSGSLADSGRQASGLEGINGATTGKMATELQATASLSQGVDGSRPTAVVVEEPYGEGVSKVNPSVRRRKRVLGEERVMVRQFHLI